MAVRNNILGGTDWGAEGVDNQDLNDTFDEVAVGIVPVGTVVPWLKSFTGVPSLPDSFVECNGQTINDSESPLDGQTVPDLNGNNRFIRAAGSSGGTGGQASHNHQALRDAGSLDGKGLTDINEKLGGYDSGGNPKTFSVGDPNSYTTNENNEPPYYDAVMVMRIK
jgi:hypothetical protein